MVRRRQHRCGFTLIELLVSIAIIALLTSILLPSLGSARELAKRATCETSLRNLGTATFLYLSDNNSYFWPISVANQPTQGVTCYFWGTNQKPVSVVASPFMNYCGNNLQSLWCPSFLWGSYVPQGGVVEPTTTYGYNAWCLDPPAWGRTDSKGNAMPVKQTNDLTNPASLFVFNDSAMFWSPGGVPILQNSTYMEPVTGTWVQTPTTHFRHHGSAVAVCADGHAEPFGLEGATMSLPSQNLGFVGTSNTPHYDQ